MVHNGVSLREIAGLDDTQLKWVYFRERDEYGALVRPEARSRVKRHVGYEAMFRQVWASRGLDAAAIEAKWQAYLAENPSMVELIERKRRMDERVRQASMRNGTHPR